MDLLKIKESYSRFRDSTISGRLLTHNHIQDSLNKLSKKIDINEIGKSTLGNPVHLITLGSGKIKILAWSQMHGNESTTTKAVFDFLNSFCHLGGNKVLDSLLKHLTIKIIPILNPDGAMAYIRENANKVDLNRDAHDLQEIESRLLRKEFEKFSPNFCLNLHDQRTIFSAGEDKKPAVLSFLTPAMDEPRKVTASRKESMKVIAYINRVLQPLLPGMIGRYDDAFNQNCTGDTFQSLQIPTILFEAGHFPGDYQREKSREFMTYALFAAFHSIATGSYKQLDHELYFRIPENRKLFFDVILRSARVKEEVVDVAIQYKETRGEKEVFFVPYLEKIAPSLQFFGHKEIDCRQKEVFWEGSTRPDENVIVDKIFVNNEILIIN